MSYFRFSTPLSHILTLYSIRRRKPSVSADSPPLGAGTGSLAHHGYSVTLYMALEIPLEAIAQRGASASANAGTVNESTRQTETYPSRQANLTRFRGCAFGGAMMIAITPAGFRGSAPVISASHVKMKKRRIRYEHTAPGERGDHVFSDGGWVSAFINLTGSDLE
ncbi:hypothetical protein BDZ94DRAFT_1298666 [Collybia nuda]|uniref:Uncharacterized protein n=1 Tax=Collybia nuda TaxID=64659 RepID=A0A9P6CHJ3_9AGAR|nr:hypothetical protein BDZ94DRAFT_1298666 [Collybia nuda]